MTSGNLGSLEDLFHFTRLQEITWRLLGSGESATGLVQFGPGSSQENVKKMSRKYGEIIKGIDQKRLWTIKERASVPPSLRLRKERIRKT